MTNKTNSSIILSGSWVLPDSENEIPDGQLRIQDGSISHIKAGLTRLFPDDPIVEYPGCVLMPGLVNAHTHLEITLLRGVGRGLPFADWIRRITSEIKARDETFFIESAHQGMKECIQSGVTTIADHSTFGMTHRVMRQAGTRGIVFKEVFCPDSREDYSDALQKLASDVQRMQGEAGPDIHIGISCHAPYNACKPALESIVCRFKEYPRSIHAAESPDEVSYIRSAEGVMAASHIRRGIPVRAWRMSPVEYLDNCSYWSKGSLAVHLTQASQGDYAILKARGVNAAFCPSSNAALGAGIPPIAQARRGGVLCGLGTDSAVSNERMDMFDEMRFAVLSSRIRNDPITPSEAFRMATSEGARAIGFPGAGLLAEGARADIVALRLPRPILEGSLVDTVVWQGGSSEIQAVWVDGRPVAGHAVVGP